MKKKVAIVVQRCHESIVGGSEALAWQYAQLLKDDYEVDVLTTTAVDAAYWTNALAAGTEEREGIKIRRFSVDIGYTPFRTELFVRMLNDFVRFGAGKNVGPNGTARHIPWPVPLQEELVRRIGPYSESLVRFLRSEWRSYRTILFVTYLYPTAYFGLQEVPRGRFLFAPTLHDEQPAYLSIYKHAARRAHSLIWLTDAERRLGHALWEELPGRIVGAWIDAEEREPPAREEAPYLLYCGRIDPNKGCLELFDYFARFKESHPSSLRLILTGKDDVPVPDHAEIDFRGFVSAEEKFRLMAGARAYVMPSARESFSIVTLEAMAQRTPVLVTAASEVLADHVRQSEGGRIYHDYESFASALAEMLADADLRRKMGAHAREYVISRYTPERIRRRLIESVESCPEPESAPQATIAAASQSTPPQGAEARTGRGVEAFQNSPPLPLPAGWTEEELRALVISIRVEDAPAAEMKNYAESDFRRFVYTLGLVPEREGARVLELGANPYFTTVLLKKFRKAELHLANFFGGRESAGSQKVFVRRTKEELTFRYKHFNIEEEAFPYPDEFFDAVLFCEIIEHLLSDPVHALAEIRRVLKANGLLILTTPNVARLENARKILAGENFYDPYSGYGPYGRHNREYTPRELFDLLSANGFTIGTLFTADVNETEAEQRQAGRISAALAARRSDLGQYIFCTASVKPEAKTLRPSRPAWLYRSLHSEHAKSPAEFTLEEFRAKFFENYEACAWQPHPLYSVFTQFDQDWYLAQKDAFTHKYRCLYAVSQTIRPERIIELGVCGGAGADAYLSAAPHAAYTGLDVFGFPVREDDGSHWDSYETARSLLKARGFDDWELIKVNLRTLEKLPTKADFVVVDASHDFENEYADLKLALTAEPTFILVDDTAEGSGVRRAVEKFLAEDAAGRVEYNFALDYIGGGGVLIKLKPGARGAK